MFFEKEAHASDNEKDDDEQTDDFFGIRQYEKKRSLSNGDTFFVKATEKNSDLPISNNSGEAEKPGKSASSETKSNTDSNPISNQLAG